MSIIAPFPYFGGKRTVVSDVWARLGEPKQYIEPFCGSAAILLAARKPASLEVIGDMNGFIANFWRAVKHQPAAVAEAADYPVSHIDQGVRHRWLMDQRGAIAEGLQEHDWPGDATAAGYWLWGQCSWIGSGWCDWGREKPITSGQISQVSDAGRGIQASGRIPYLISPGMGIQASGQIPQVGNAGDGYDRLLTSGGRAAWLALHKLAARLDRVRIIHGDWDRCLNHNYGGNSTAVFLDPPYRAYEDLYGAKEPVADAVAAWAKDHPHLRVALCGHVGDYDLPGWDAVQWKRPASTYGGSGTTDQECIWYSPACIPAERTDLFSAELNG